MARRIVVVPATYEAVKDQFDDDLFWEVLAPETVEAYAAIEPESELDHMVAAGLQYALGLKMPESKIPTML